MHRSSPPVGFHADLRFVAYVDRKAEMGWPDAAAPYVQVEFHPQASTSAFLPMPRFRFNRCQRVARSDPLSAHRGAVRSRLASPR